jgi:nucleoside permease NupC
MQVALSVGAMLIAFVGLIYLFNGVLSGVGAWFGIEGLTLQWLLGQMFAPVAYLLDVPSRRHDIARPGLKAVIGGTLVNLMNAALAGLFYSLL